MAATGALLIVVFSILVMWSLSHALATRSTGKEAAGGTRPLPRLMAALAVGTSLGLAAPLTAQPMYVMAAAVGALSTAAAIGLSREVGAAYGDVAYAVPSLAIVPPGHRGSISAVGAAVAAITVFATAGLAFGVRLIGPSDAGLIALAGILAVLVDRWLDRFLPAGGASPLLGGALAACVGAALTAAIVVALP